MKEKWELTIEVEIEKPVSTVEEFTERRLYSTPTYKVNIIERKLASP